MSKPSGFVRRADYLFKVLFIKYWPRAAYLFNVWAAMTLLNFISSFQFLLRGIFMLNLMVFPRQSNKQIFRTLSKGRPKFLCPFNSISLCCLSYAYLHWFPSPSNTHFFLMQIYVCILCNNSNLFTKLLSVYAYINRTKKKKNETL